MPNYSDLNPAALKPAWSDGTNLKAALTTSNYSGGTPSAANEVKASLLNADGSLKASLLVGGELSPGILRAECYSFPDGTITLNGSPLTLGGAYLTLGE